MNTLIIFALLLGLSNPLSAHVDLDYPQGGETFIEGETIVITWHIVVPHATLNWDLLFSTNGGADWEPILMNIPLDSLSYTWVVPSIFSAQCRVRVIQDNTGQDYYGTSMDFTILPNTSAPSMDAPGEDVIIECDVDEQEMIIQAWLENHGGASATNFCSELVWTHDFFELSDGCGASGSSLVVFTATDDCGSTYTVATVSVIDSQAPVFDITPVDLVVECDGLGNSEEFYQWANNYGGAQASDACGNVQLIYEIILTNETCGESGLIGVDFSATDDCANSSPWIAMFQIVDSSPPSITQTSRDTMIACSANSDQVIQSWLNDHAGAQANDVCGDVSWTHNFTDLILSCGGAGSASVTFTATDECGNSSTTLAILTVQDSHAPVVHVVAKDTVIACGGSEMSMVIQGWLDRNGGAQASDGCGSVSWANDYVFVTDSCIMDTVLVTFTATDECGNSVSTQALLTTIDTITEQNETTVFAPIGTTWYYSGVSFGPPWHADPLFGYYFVEKDTLMLGRNARVNGWYDNNEGVVERVDSFTKYISVSGDQVHYKVGDEFVLLYDFSAMPGDTIHSKVESSDLSLGCLSSFEEEIIDFAYVIDSVSTVFIDGEELRVQYVTSMYESPDDNWGFIFEPIIERIGYYGWGGFWWGQGLGCILETGYLRCYEDPEISWRSSAFNGNLPCDYLSTYDPASIEYISLHPNPTSGLVYLPEGAEHIEVFSMEGRKIVFERNVNEIDLTGCHGGMYVVRFEVEGRLYLGKVVVK